MTMPGRKFSAGGAYRYGFNGQENSDEIAAGLTTAMYWEYDSRIGRRWNEDPVLKEYESPYLCFSGNPIWYNDINGDDPNPPGYDWQYAKKWQDFHMAAIRVAYNTLVERQTAKDFNWNKNNQYRIRANMLATAGGNDASAKSGFTKSQFINLANNYYRQMENAFNWSANETVSALRGDLKKYNNYSGSDTKSQKWAIRENYYLIDEILDKPETIADRQETIFYKCATFAQIWTSSAIGSGVSYSYAGGVPWLTKAKVPNRTFPKMPAGKEISGVDDVLKNPLLLKGKSVDEIKELLGNSKNWVKDVMRKSKTNPNGGFVLREMNEAGTDFTGRIIQYHPGTSRHYNWNPYWKVSDGTTTVRFPVYNY